MPDRDEPADLEAERDRLLSMTAYHKRATLRVNLSLAPWVRFVLLGITCGVGALMVAAIAAGQIDLPMVAFPVVFLVLAAYISTRRINLFGTSMLVAEIMSFLTLSPPLPTPGDADVRQRFSDCEARIAELKEGRP
jgi:hypothetical protein